jgi:hypothetical protein
MDRVDKYEERLTLVLSRYKLIVESIIDFIDKVVLKTISTLKNAVYQLVEFINLISIMGRYSTIPIHWLWIWWDLKFGRIENPIDYSFFQVGGHYIYGKPGSGKSTFTYHSMMQYAYMTGKCALTTEYMELPRKKINGSSFYYHQVFSPSDIFKDGEQVAGFPEGFNFIVYEEMLTKYNQRNNKQSAYNDEVIPMIGAMGTQRHQGIDLFYFISQLPVTDVQIMLMLKGYHVPKIAKKFDYPYWLNTGKIRFIIKGWWITSYEIVPKGGNDYELVKQGRLFYPCTLQEDMSYFNRLNMKSTYDSKPKMKVKAYTI